MISQVSKFSLETDKFRYENIYETGSGNNKFQMRIELKKFGELLISRPAGREAYLAMSAYLTRDLKKEEKIEIDFSGVKVLTPSWADEVITPLANEFLNIELFNTNNPTVKATLKTLREYSGGNL